MRRDFLGCSHKCSKTAVAIVPSGDDIVITYSDGTYTTASKEIISPDLINQGSGGATPESNQLQEKVDKLIQAYNTLVDNVVDIKNTSDETINKAFKSDFSPSQVK